MIRWLCGLIGHPISAIPIADNKRRFFCFCGLTDYIVPMEFLE